MLVVDLGLPRLPRLASFCIFLPTLPPEVVTTKTPYFRITLTVIFSSDLLPLGTHIHVTSARAGLRKVCCSLGRTPLFLVFFFFFSSGHLKEQTVVWYGCHIPTSVWSLLCLFNTALLRPVMPLIHQVPFD